MMVPKPSICSFTSSAAPTTQTATYPRLPIKVMSGIIRPDKNCDFHALVYSL